MKIPSVVAALLLTAFSAIAAGALPTATAPSPTFQATPNAVLSVLCYHNVDLLKPKDTPYSVTSSLLEQHILALQKAGFTFVSMEQVRKFYDSGLPLPAKAVLLTFDDGRYDVYVHAYPLLRSMGVPWAMFVYPSGINVGHDRNFMNWDDVRDLAAHGVAIGSHSWDHPYLTKPPANVVSAAEYSAWLDKELVSSKKTIEKEIGMQVYAFATPFGALDGVVQKRIVAAGYSLSFNVYGSGNDLKSDPLYLNRLIVVAKESPEALVKRLGEKPLHLAKQRPAPLSIVSGAFDRMEFALPELPELDRSTLKVIVNGEDAPFTVDAEGGITVKVALPERDKGYLVAVRAESKTGAIYSQSWYFVFRKEIPGYI
ncbi:polysaccharide deacetylase family protein [bacterium]|nr:polysaccharide deacetylase family protein [bacterium]